MAKKDKGITVRLTEEVADKFKTYAQNNNISQGEFLEELLNQYENRKYAYNTETGVSNKQIPIFLCYENFFLEDKNKQIREPKKCIIKGEYVYWLQQQKPMFSAKLYEEELKNEFGINCDLDGYMFYYWVGIVKDCEKQRFIIVETLLINKDDGIKNMLNINRCKFAMNLSEITEHIRCYALPQDIKSIENILAETIAEDEAIESFLK